MRRIVPLSLMAHLAGAEGRPIAVGDGPGVPWDQLLPNDLLVQRYILAAPQDLAAGTYWLHTGGYWLETLAHFPILVGQ